MYDEFVSRETCCVYEIYPQNETPRLTRIAHLVVFEPPQTICAYLLLGIVVWRYSVMDKIVLQVWDYQLNHSITFAIDNNFDYHWHWQHEVYFILSKGIKLVSNLFVGR